jgi:Na+-transporting NADH:ubiquinone oxidoreductase subunit F
MLQLLVPMFVFTGVVFVLACAVLAARRQLIPAAEVAVTINGQRTFTAATGDKLLWQLAGQGVYLPAACGGRGACGQCRVEVVCGGGGVLAPEAGHLSLAEVQRGIRLACMVTVREPMEIRVPADVLEARRWQAQVRGVRHLSTFLRELTLELPEAMAFEAGDYVLIDAPPGEFPFAEFAIEEQYLAEWRRLGFLQLTARIPATTLRAYSLANPPAQSGIAQLVVRIATPPAHSPPDTPPGMVSSYLYSLKPGDAVALSGPFGEFHACESGREMVVIGGGAGIAPLRSMILDQLQAKRSKRQISFWYGARNLRELCYREEFSALARDYDNFRYEVALSQPEADDVWSGPTGLIHKVAFDMYLNQHARPEELEYYLCGPPLMTAAVHAMLEDLGVDGQSIFMDDFGG